MYMCYRGCHARFFGAFLAYVEKTLYWLCIFPKLLRFKVVITIFPTVDAKSQQIDMFDGLLLVIFFLPRIVYCLQEKFCGLCYRT
jgi:hypothetical protein